MVRVADFFCVTVSKVKSATESYGKTFGSKQVPVPGDEDRAQQPSRPRREPGIDHGMKGETGLPTPDYLHTRDAMKA